MQRRHLLFLALGKAAAAASFSVPLRTRTEAFRGAGEWQEATFRQSLATEHCALVLCDLWDKPCGTSIGAAAQRSV